VEGPFPLAKELWCFIKSILPYCLLLSIVYCLLSPDKGLSFVSRQWIVYCLCLLSIVHCLLSIVFCLQTMDCRLSIVYCLLSQTRDCLLSPDNGLSIVDCLLSIVYCLNPGHSTFKFRVWSKRREEVLPRKVSKEEFLMNLSLVLKKPLFEKKLLNVYSHFWWQTGAVKFLSDYAKFVDNFCHESDVTSL